MTPRLVAALALAAALALPATVHAADPSLRLGSTGQRVLEVEYRLRSIGYSVAVDTVFDARTDRAARHFQRASGLTPDGVIGPMTLTALSAVTATRPAVRLNPPAPSTPNGLDACGEMSWWRQHFGLPAVFDPIGYRESRCRNDVTSRTGCCFGYWQNFLSSHLSRQSAYRERIIDECGVTQVADILGLSATQKRASACVTYVVWSISGMSPWALQP